MAKWEILDIDPWIKDYENDINLRMSEYEKAKKRLIGDGQTLSDLSLIHI